MKMSLKSQCNQRINVLIDCMESLGNSNGGRFTTFGGGLPIVNADGEVVGGIGASTGTPAQDQEVVQAGKEAVERVLREEAYRSARVKAKL